MCLLKGIYISSGYDRASSERPSEKQQPPISTFGANLWWFIQAATFNSLGSPISSLELQERLIVMLALAVQSSPGPSMM